MLDEVEDLGMAEMLVALTPMERLGRPDEVAQAIVFLACEERSSYVSASVLSVDGGWTAQ